MVEIGNGGAEEQTVKTISEAGCDNNQPPTGGKTELFVITAYCPCYECSEGWGNSTATGVTATEGRTIAVDPKVIPYGTEVYIEGVGYRTAEDCGGAIKGNKIDLYFSDHNGVNNFGKHTKEVTILY